ncbi:MAG: hypothetical protein O7G30_11550 [Proteobacteria bacterium]|nr:hypothetical protein [Pseudomonadota bacterium]
MRIRWPSGVHQRLTRVRRNRTIVVWERRTCGASFEILGLALWPLLRRRRRAGAERSGPA